MLYFLTELTLLWTLDMSLSLSLFLSPSLLPSLHPFLLQSNIFSPISDSGA